MGFTLLELLIVITIIGLLTAMLMTAMGSADAKAKKALAATELGQLDSAIQDYKTRLGFYPPDNPTNAAMAPLYFELRGTTNDGMTYVTLDASAKISLADLNADFDRQGFANSSRHAHSSDEAGAPMSFLNQLRFQQMGEPIHGQPQIKILVCSIGWPAGDAAAPIPGTSLNPWRYVSSNPTHNTGSYDLWVDLPIGKKIYRVSNWNKEPEIVP
jgi:prepilin-type N-terminal cleavage/methylation domain-containing protein